MRQQSGPAYRGRNGGAFKAMGIAAVAIACFYMMTVWHGKTGAAALHVGATAAIMMDAGTGEVLFEKNADVALPPASMSKMMTELIVLELVNEGKLEWNEPVTTSRYAAGVPGSQVGFNAGESFTVRELFEALTVHSANDAAVAIAEHAAGSEPEFVKLMNSRADRIGMSEQALFANATGLNRNDLTAFAESASDGDTMLTASDVALLAGHLLNKYPEVLEVSSRSSIKLASSGHRLASTNLMLEDMPFAYPGNDGLKTGYTPEAGYCFTGTAKQDGRRLITVVMGSATSESRFEETQKLFKFGFHDKSGGLLATVQNSLGLMGETIISIGR
ncbi:D-alanyl-D-alanine carboxypeptidase family protein [Paenibacillus harenae]|uniref:D-alanyl-D-alanine carboxypeptidase (Penicillin-binding protein 5/6) n=2 Tax=Paenibacillus harenae TaxID=306543 RepID=A0ABT9TTV2_PAEHA|nr:D-alanyl-D-alanine carboxypeptidase family protein [Paenibacillus harenae]MDQ0110776.1 D-alanyl-D-alanine carboxypeptidase (penicillin-binding protein 5/6) [Paenibacillus harenae]